MKELPAIPLDLLEALEKRFPDKAPSGTETERSLWIETGKVHLVRFLRATFDIQNKNVLGDDDVQSTET